MLGGACSSGDDQAFPDAAPNRLVIITTEGGIVTMNPDGSDVTTIMEAQDDAAVLPAAVVTPNGRLAWTLAVWRGARSSPLTPQGATAGRFQHPAGVLPLLGARRGTAHGFVQQ